MSPATAPGPAEATLRYRFGGGDPKKLRENLETYVRKEYGAKSLGRLETGDTAVLRANRRRARYAVDGAGEALLVRVEERGER